VGDKLRSVTDDTWTADVLQSDKPVLVDFWAEWCAPCRKIAPMLDEIVGEMGDKVEIVKLNIDENPNTARDYGIMSIPTLTVFKGGEPVQSVLGIQPKGSIIKMIESAL
jgi:thioredoxin 1